MDDDSRGRPPRRVHLARPRSGRRSHARLPARRHRMRRDVARLSRGACRRHGVRRARLQPRRIRRLRPRPASETAHLHARRGIPRPSGTSRRGGRPPGVSRRAQRRRLHRPAARFDAALPAAGPGPAARGAARLLRGDHRALHREGPRRIPPRRPESEARAVPWRERRLRLLGVEPGMARSRVSRLEHRGSPARRHGPGARGAGDRRSVRDPFARSRRSSGGAAARSGAASSSGAATARIATGANGRFRRWPRSSAGSPTGASGKEMPAPSKALPRAFYDRDTVAVARDLLGKHLVHVSRGVEYVGRIVEVEAYLGKNDLASHSSQREGPGGRASCSARRATPTSTWCTGCTAA